MSRLKWMAALRTTFRKENGQLSQLIQAEAKVDFTVLDASSWSDTALEEQIILFTQQAYDLALDAMLQARLFTLASDDHILIIKVHHLAADGWSMWCGYPLDVQIMDNQNKLSGLFIYNQEMFEEATIRTMTEEFKKILATVVERPELTISELVDGIG